MEESNATTVADNSTADNNSTDSDNATDANGIWLRLLKSFIIMLMINYYYY